MTEQVKFTYSPLGNTLKKQMGALDNQGRKQIDAIMNQNERPEKMIKHFLIKKYLKNSLENPDNLIYYYKGNTAGKKFYDLDNGIKLLEK